MVGRKRDRVHRTIIGLNLMFGRVNENILYHKVMWTLLQVFLLQGVGCTVLHSSTQSQW